MFISAEKLDILTLRPMNIILHREAVVQEANYDFSGHTPAMNTQAGI